MKTTPTGAVVAGVVTGSQPPLLPTRNGGAERETEPKSPHRPLDFCARPGRPSGAMLWGSGPQSDIIRVGRSTRFGGGSWSSWSYVGGRRRRLVVVVVASVVVVVVATVVLVLVVVVVGGLVVVVVGGRVVSWSVGRGHRKGRVVVGPEGRVVVVVDRGRLVPGSQQPSPWCSRPWSRRPRPSCPVP